MVEHWIVISEVVGSSPTIYPLNTNYNFIKNYSTIYKKNKIVLNIYNNNNNLIKNIKVLDSFKPLTIKLENRIKNINVVSITKPKNQFFLTFFNNNVFTYSTGMIIRSLKLETRAIRRNKLGYMIFLSFFLKKFKQNSFFNKKTNIIILKKFNKINCIKNTLIKLFFNQKITLILKVSKNYNKKNYKKISYINKRLRKKYHIE